MRIGKELISLKNKIKEAYEAKNKEYGMNLPNSGYYDQVVKYVNAEGVKYGLELFVKDWCLPDHPSLNFFFNSAQIYKQMQRQKTIL